MLNVFQAVNENNITYRDGKPKMRSLPLRHSTTNKTRTLLSLQCLSPLFPTSCTTTENINLKSFSN